jgi:hypothetical protein
MVLQPAEHFIERSDRRSLRFHRLFDVTRYERVGCLLKLAERRVDGGDDFRLAATIFGLSLQVALETRQVFELLLLLVDEQRECRGGIAVNAPRNVGAFAFMRRVLTDAFTDRHLPPMQLADSPQ